MLLPGMAIMCPTNMIYPNLWSLTRLALIIVIPAFLLCLPVPAPDMAQPLLILLSSLRDGLYRSIHSVHPIITVSIQIRLFIFYRCLYKNLSCYLK